MLYVKEIIPALEILGSHQEKNPNMFTLSGHKFLLYSTVGRKVSTRRQTPIGSAA